MRISVFALLVVAAVVGAELAPLLHMNNPEVIKGSYIVILKEGTTVAQRDAHIAELNQAIDAAADTDSKVVHKYHINSFIGFSAQMSDVFLAQERANPLVKYIEADSMAHALQANPITQPGATWGISRISQHITENTNYVYPPSAGAGVNVYVLDTGIYTQHNEFAGRASIGTSFVTGENGNDGNGHGTHCAGTIAGTIYGVAKHAGIIGVQVLSRGGSGAWSGVISGVDWVATDVAAKGVPGVASMSLGGGVTQSVDDAVAASIEAGIPYAIAAGNSNFDACQFSPARVPTAVTVGSTEKTDARSYFSNYGTCVDVFAPGTDITAAWIGNPTALNTISGTSMATPHVAGVLAIARGLYPDATPEELSTYITSVATKNVVTNPGTGSPNLLLYSPPVVPVIPPAAH